MTFRKFVRLIKNTKRKYRLNTGIRDGRSAQCTQSIWFWAWLQLCSSSLTITFRYKPDFVTQPTISLGWRNFSTWEIAFNYSDPSPSADCKRGKTLRHKPISIGFGFAPNWLKTATLQWSAGAWLNEIIKPIRARPTNFVNKWKSSLKRAFVHNFLRTFNAT